jgi:hypothetical protein
VKEGGVWSVAFGPGETIVAGFGDRDRGGVVFLGARGERLRPAPWEVNEGRVQSVAVRPDGTISLGFGRSALRSLAWAQFDNHSVGGVVTFNDSGARIQPAPWEVNEGIVRSVVFGPDGMIAAGYISHRSGLRVQGGIVGEGGVVLFDARGERLRPVPLDVHEGNVTSVAFGPGGMLAVGVSAPSGVRPQGALMILDANPASWRRKARQLANRNLTRKEWSDYFHRSPYRRTIRSCPWPEDLPRAEREQAEVFERTHARESDALFEPKTRTDPLDRRTASQ